MYYAIVMKFSEQIQHRLYITGGQIKNNVLFSSYIFVFINLSTYIFIYYLDQFYRLILLTAFS